MGRVQEPATSAEAVAADTLSSDSEPPAQAQLQTASPSTSSASPPVSPSAMPDVPTSPKEAQEAQEPRLTAQELVPLVQAWRSLLASLVVHNAGAAGVNAPPSSTISTGSVASTAPASATVPRPTLSVPSLSSAVAQQHVPARATATTALAMPGSEQALQAQQAAMLYFMQCVASQASQAGNVPSSTADQTVTGVQARG